MKIDSKYQKVLFLVILLCPVVISAIGEPNDINPAKRVDHPHETGWLFSIAAAYQTLKPAEKWRNDIYDFTDSKQGDFSVCYTVNEKEDAGVIGFTPGQFLKGWNLSDQNDVTFWIKVKGEPKPEKWVLSLVDSKGHKTNSTISKVLSEAWQEIRVPLSQFLAEKNFSWIQISALQFELQLKPGSKIWFDDIRFSSEKNQKSTIGITDKTYEQRMSEAEATHDKRVEMAFEIIAKDTNWGGQLDLNKYFAKLWLGKDLKETNQSLQEIFTTEDPAIIRQYSLQDNWSLYLKPMVIRMYFNFSSKSKIKPGRLEKKTEAALLEFLWKKSIYINDISLARKSTWWIVGSENHDINSKVAALLTSQIFMNEPEYADRIYPDRGTGGGSGYWFHQMYGEMKDDGPEGSGNWADGKEYRAVDHYHEWVKYWNEYIVERARKGFFLEVASSGYMKHSITFLMNIYDFCDDQTLKKRTGMFLDLIWAEWAQDQLSAVRGGAKTRWSLQGFDSMWEGSRFYLGGPTDATGWWYGQVQSSYEWPEIVWRLALDRKGKGEYSYSSRKPGEEQPELQPRPDGLERTMAVNTESRFNRYSWVTPDYILGTQMDHPSVLHSHLSAQDRWQGASFSSDFQTSISTCGIDISNPEKWERVDSYYRSVQYKNVLITQQNRRWMQQDPTWFPTKDRYSQNFGVLFDGEFDNFIEKNGWIFVQKGNAYIALRPLMGDYIYNPETWMKQGSGGLSSSLREDTYEWGPNKKYIKFIDKYSPLIIESGRKSKFPTIEEFKAYILKKHLELKKTVMPGWYIVVYGDGTDESPQFYFNAANNEIPKVNGSYINYAPPFTFSSPFLKSEYKSGIVKLTVDGIEELWDFN